MRAIVCAAATSAVVLASAFTAAPARAADDPSYLTIGAGSWETMRDKDRSGEPDLAYRSDYHLWIFKPHAGVVIAGDGDALAYAGLLTDIYWGKRIVTTLSTSVGGWGGHGFNLGSTIEFRSGIDLAYRFDDHSRLGVGFYHASNAGLTHRNPGAESAIVSYAIPLNEIVGLFGSTTPAHQTAEITPPKSAVTEFSKPE